MKGTEPGPGEKAGMDAIDKYRGFDILSPGESFGLSGKGIPARALSGPGPGV